MTIELVTGTPGAGKTCYVVSQRIAAEIGREVTAEDQFHNEVKVQRRVVVAGVRGLKLAHERLPHVLTGEKIAQADIDRWNQVDARGEPVHSRLPGEEPQEVEASLFNWWAWCRPGDLIVIDEVQFIVPRGTLGKKPPWWIQSLEVHRHYGVDFLFVTQHPDLLDPTIRKLVGMHRHVRAIMGSAVCGIYTWDHASNPERYASSNKSIWRRKASHFALYKSAVAHVKPPSTGRWAVVAIPLLLVVAGCSAMRFKDRWARPANTPVAAASSASGAPVATATAGLRQPIPIARPEGWQDVPKLSGCYTHGTTCTCLDHRGLEVNVAQPMCERSAAGFDGLVLWEPRKEQPRQDPYGASVGPQSPSSPASSPIPKLL